MKKIRTSQLRSGVLWDLNSKCGCAMGHILKDMGLSEQIMDGAYSPSRCIDKAKDEALIEEGLKQDVIEFCPHHEPFIDSAKTAAVIHANDEYMARPTRTNFDQLNKQLLRFGYELEDDRWW